MQQRRDNGKVLVTGGSGFVGSHLVDELLGRGYAVRCLVRKTSDLKYLKHSAIDFVYGGLDDSTDWDAAFDGVDSVYHVAGLTFARRRNDYYRVNHRGTEAILAAAVKRSRQIRKFIHISSLAAIGPGRNGVPVDEEAEASPITAYGRSKLMAEQAVWAVSSLVPVTIIRPPAVYGPRDYALYELFKSISKGLSPTIGRYEKHVSLVHVRDLAAGILLAGESDVSTGRAYFISSDEIYSMQAVVDLLSRIFGHQVKVLAIPRGLAIGMAIAAEAAAAVLNRRPIINRDKVRDFSQVCWGCSVERARQELGYAQKVPLEDGLRETIEWYRREGWL